MNPLTNKHCREYSNSESALSLGQIDKLQRYTPNWLYDVSTNLLIGDFKFKNYQQTMIFVNQVAQIAETENHHPQMRVSYDQCKISYNTHTVDGITENDFICAAKIDACYLRNL